MSDVFQAVAEATLKETSGSSPSPAEGNTQTDIAPSAQEKQQAQGPSEPSQAAKTEVAIAIAELDKMDKFKFDGQEYTTKELKAAIMRQKDYTQKTMSLAQERKALEEEKKFRDNLDSDLDFVKANPKAVLKNGLDVVSAFLQTYPEKFHPYLFKVLEGAAVQPGQEPKQSPSIDVQLLNRINKLERFEQSQSQREQEAQAQKYEVEIGTIRDEMLKTFPEADVEKALARAYEASMAHQKDQDIRVSQGLEVEPFPLRETLEKVFKQSHEEEEKRFQAKYGAMVKKQTEKNTQGRDVGAGGGTAGRAPVKFTRFDDLAKHAEEIARGG